MKLKLKISAHDIQHTGNLRIAVNDLVNVDGWRVDQDYLFVDNSDIFLFIKDEKLGHSPIHIDDDYTEIKYVTDIVHQTIPPQGSVNTGNGLSTLPMPESYTTVEHRYFSIPELNIQEDTITQCVMAYERLQKPRGDIPPKVKDAAIPKIRRRKIILGAS